MAIRAPDGANNWDTLVTIVTRSILTSVWRVLYIKTGKSWSEWINVGHNCSTAGLVVVTV